jgi:hypothetical protein
MTKSIYKYQLDGNTTVLNLPMGSKILSVQRQCGAYQLWALVDVYAKGTLMEQVTIHMVGTGWHLPHDFVGEFISTVQDGGLVFHFFYSN